MPPLYSLRLTPQPSPAVPTTTTLLQSTATLSTKPSNNQLPQHTSLSCGTATLHHRHLPADAAAALSLQFKEKILCLEIMGVDSGRALALNPSLRDASLPSIHSVVAFLRSKGIHHKDLARIFGMCPTVLTSDVQANLFPIFAFLSKELGVPDSNFRKAINKCPRLLASSVRNQLKPALFYLQRLGFKDLEALAYQDPILLVSNVEKTLMPKLDYLVSLGYSRAEAVGMVLRCPGLFTFSVEKNFKPKFGYYMGEMEGTLLELKGFPQYFGFSLDKRIVPRHREMVERGLRLPLASMLKSSDHEFYELLDGKRPYC